MRRATKTKRKGRGGEDKEDRIKLKASRERGDNTDIIPSLGSGEHAENVGGLAVREGME